MVVIKDLRKKKAFENWFETEIKPNLPNWDTFVFKDVYKSYENKIDTSLKIGKSYFSTALEEKIKDCNVQITKNVVQNKTTFYLNPNNLIPK